jgi:hypothetical protein
MAAVTPRTQIAPAKFGPAFANRNFVIDLVPNTIHSRPTFTASLR